MRTIAGAIIVLAGAIVVAAAVHGAEVSHAAGRSPGSPSSTGAIAGIILTIVGFVVLALGLRENRLGA